MAPLLERLDVGNSVAEHDAALERYFVETATFRSVIADEADIIAGDKGTGKTALYKILQKRYTTVSELANVEVVAAFNPVGNPVFQRLAQGTPLQEGEYTTIWKAYIFSLVGNWLLSLYEDSFTDRMFELETLLRRTGLLSNDDSPASIFGQVLGWVRRVTHPQSD